MSEDLAADGSRPLPAPGDDELQISAADFREQVGEDLRHALDLTTWHPGADLTARFEGIQREVGGALAQEQVALGRIREEFFPILERRQDAPPGAGVYSAELATLELVHRGLLFNGGVEACDGTVQPYDTLPLTIYQIGVCLVSYQGNQGTWSQRFFRRDLRASGGDPAAELLELLERRQARGGLNQPGRRDRLSELIRRGIMAYAERAFLLERSDAVWRMGHGNPAPYELITGSGSLDLLIAATNVIRAMIEHHQRFVFVPSEPADRVLMTIGQALPPLHYAIVDTLRDQMYTTVEHGHYRWAYDERPRWDGTPLTPEQWIRKFRDEVAPKVVRGIYRATELAPGQVFYAHVDHADVAAHVALADSVLQAHRGFPLMIDLAHHVGSAVFGRDTLVGPASAAYADAGAPWRYVSERATRYG